MNQDIRKLIRIAGVTHWQVAECYGVHESSFSRMLRKELDKNDKRKVKEAIKVAKEKYYLHNKALI